MKQKLYFSLLFIFVEIVLLVSISINNEDKKNKVLEQRTQEIKSQYKSITNGFKQTANIVLNGYVLNENTIKIFEKRDRESLYKHLSKNYTFLKQLDFNIVHFHTPDNHSFLRLHQPNKHSDDLSHIRCGVAYVNGNHKPIYGLGIGRYGVAYRNIYPIFNEDNSYIGSVENSFSPMALIRQLENIYDLHTHFLLKKDIVDKKVISVDNTIYQESVEHPSYYKLNTENCKSKMDERERKFNLLQVQYKDTVEEGTKKIETFSFPFLKKGSYKIVTFLPLFNIDKNHIGYLVTYSFSKELDLLSKEELKRYIIFTLVWLLIIIIFYKQSMQKRRLKEEVKKQTIRLNKSNLSLAKKTKKLNRLNKDLNSIVEEEVEKSRKKDFEIMESQKMVAMGEMIGNIAHQWRQPLSVISTLATGSIMSKEYGILDDESFMKNMHKIDETTQYLSETIEIFRNFIKEKKVYERQIVQKSIKNALSIAGVVLKDVNITLEDNIDYENDIIIEMVSGELPQVIINIINNAKDVLIEKKVDNPLIIIDLEQSDFIITITIEDNGGGIPDDVLPHIFEPYFTTKHQSQGTGLGLHMSFRIITESLGGKLYAKNTSLGAKFYIEIPKEGKNNNEFTRD